MKNFLCNIPLYIGALILVLSFGIKKVSEKLMEISFRLHMRFGTEAGNKLKEQERLLRERLARIKQAQQDGQLAKILLGENNGKRTTDH